MLELFTFIQLQGPAGKHASGRDAPIAVFALRQDSASAQVLQTALCKFDASNAQCFLSKDRHKLLGVIETAFGDLRRRANDPTWSGSR